MATAGPESGPPPFVQLAAHALRWRLLSELAGSDRRVRELVARVEEPQNLVSYHLRLLRDAGLVHATRSSFDGREAYYHLDLDRCAHGLAASGDALHPALRRDVPPRIPAVERWPSRPAVLFVCTGNSARSPIAEALLRHHTAGQVDVTSAGSQPRDAMHPGAVRVLRDAFGIDISSQRPRHLESLADHRFDYVLTLCDRAREVCPDFPGHPRHIHWSIADPSAGGRSSPGNSVFERTLAEIDTRVRHLLPVLAATVTQTQEVEP